MSSYYSIPIYGICRQTDKKIFVYDTINFPLKAKETDRIGYIINDSIKPTNVSEISMLSVLRCDGSNVISGEFVNSNLVFHFIDETFYENGKCRDNGDCTPIFTNIREISDNDTSEEIKILQFIMMSEPLPYHGNLDGTILNSKPISSGLLEDDVPHNPTQDAIEALRNDLNRTNDRLGFEPITQTSIGEDF